MTGDPVPFWGRINSAGILRCDCALCREPLSTFPTVEEAAPISPEAWAALPVPNRLYGAEINHEGDAI
jgi:hypothetical protein